MKRILIIALCLLMALPLTGFAASEGWYQVASTSPNGYCYLYSNPTSSDADSVNLGKYVNGQTVYVMDYYGGNGYCFVRTQEGKTGYIRATSLTYAGWSNWDETNPGWFKVASYDPYGYCYLYSAASDRDGVSENLGEYRNGALVYVMDYYGGQEGKYNYCRVRTRDGKVGFMHDYALTPYDGYVDDNGLGSLPSLAECGRGTVINGSAAVYTGPGTAFYRTANGKATVGGGSSVTIYGREGNYYLIRYQATLNGESITRWSMIPVSRVQTWYDMPELSYAWRPMRIHKDAHLSDAPNYSDEYTAIDVNRDSAYALALYISDSGRIWVYFESTGYAYTSNQSGLKSVRGFVPIDDVEMK